jgi:ABC-type glycerol-3-phosphate transport system substrate-binding protein
VVALTWRTFSFSGLYYFRSGVFEEPQERLLRFVAALEEDVDNPNGPARGRYTLSPGLIGQGDYPDPPPRNDDEFAEWIDSIDTDLLSISPSMAESLGKRGVILPLERFITADDQDISETFYPYLLDQFRGEGGLFALPIGANPLLLYYDPGYFRRRGVSPPDETWRWDDLLTNAVKLTQRDDEGNTTRWGLMPHFHGLWWALWQNEAEVVDSVTGRCRLQDTAATAALQFCHDLFHSHRVAPPAVGMERWEHFGKLDDTVPAMFLSTPTMEPRYDYRLAALPQGKVRSVPVSADMGLAIHARSGHTEAAYTALKGLLQSMQRFVAVPAQKNMVARLQEIRADRSPTELTALQQSMEFGRALPWDERTRHAMHHVVDGLARGDEVATVVNDACATLKA